MNQRLRQERNVFLLFLAAVFVSLMSALPIVTATLPSVRYAQAEQPPTVVTFESLDRYAQKKGNPAPNESGRQEMLENVINDYL